MSDVETLNVTGSSYFDGDRPVPRPALLSVDREAHELVIASPGEDPVRWPISEVRRLEDQARGVMVLRWVADPLARLVLKGLGTEQVLRVLPKVSRRAPPNGRLRLGLWALGALVAVAVQIGVLIPLLANQLAQFIPPEGEQALGEATFGQIRQALDETGLGVAVPLCEAPDGIAALEVMRQRLEGPSESAFDVQVYVLDHPMVNAFALPGGNVVFFRGLIDAAQSPNEVAAVMAHEIGHVVNRDPTRHALRSAGSIGVLGLLFGDFAGGAAVLFLAERLISANYSQDAEIGADLHAHVALERAGISPAALGDMFDRLRQSHGDTEGVVAHFLSHPTLGERIDSARRAARLGVSYGDILSKDQWQAIKEVCEKP